MVNLVTVTDSKLSKLTITYSTTQYQMKTVLQICFPSVTGEHSAVLVSTSNLREDMAIVDYVAKTFSESRRDYRWIKSLTLSRFVTTIEQSLFTKQELSSWTHWAEYYELFQIWTKCSLHEVMFKERQGLNCLKKAGTFIPRKILDSLLSTVNMEKTIGYRIVAIVSLITVMSTWWLIS